MAQFSRIFDIPAELRYHIYHLALLPETLHVSLTGTKGTQFLESFDLPTGRITRSSPTSLKNSRKLDSRKISFEHIFELEDRLVIEPFSIWNFRVNRQIYAELQHLFYNKCIWYFDSLDSLISGLIFLPGHVRMRIRHLKFTMISIELHGRVYSLPRVTPPMRGQQWTLPSISSLLQSNLQLRYLRIHYSKSGMLLGGVVGREERQLNEGHRAARAVAQFVWPGMVTSLLYSNAEMTQDLVHSAGQICGAQNVEWRSRGQDRYCTPWAELVIRQPLEPLPK